MHDKIVKAKRRLSEQVSKTGQVEQSATELDKRNSLLQKEVDTLNQRIEELTRLSDEKAETFRSQGTHL